MEKSQINGFKGLDKLLRQLAPNVEKRVLQGAVTGAMRVGAKEIRANVPRHVDEQSPASKLYGPLAKNIKVERLRRVRKGQKGARVTTGKAFWGFIYEMGSRYQPARPFFAPSFRKAQEAIQNELVERIYDGITKEALKLVGKK